MLKTATAIRQSRKQQVSPLDTEMPAASGLQLDGLDAILGLHVGTVNTIIAQYFQRTLGDLALTPKQTSTLWLVSANPGVSQVELARFFRIERATMLAITNSLTEQGLLERRPSARDRRSIALHATPEGESKLALARAAVARHERWLQSVLSPEESAFLIHLLKRLGDRPTLDASANDLD